MLDKREIFAIHQYADQGYSKARISRLLHLDKKTVAKYLADPEPKRKKVHRRSLLDPFRAEIKEMLSRDDRASAAVILQRIQDKGFTGKITIVRDYLASVRPKARRAFIRFESAPGEQCQVDWGHFGVIGYGNTARKLYCLAVTECHSRMLYLEFGHSQSQQALHRGLWNAFVFLGGTTRELVHDNMLTAVIERDGSLVRYNTAFLDFLRRLKISPRACNRAAPQEKGKVEKGVIHYIRHNFWPLRTFTDLDDLQRQADIWRDNVANVRIHATTGEKPAERFQPAAMRPIDSAVDLDLRDRATAKVHVDFSVRFDGNTYTVPPWAVGRQVVIAADHRQVTIYYKTRIIAVHQRSWQRKQRIESPHHRQAALKGLRRQWASAEVAAFASLGEEAREYLEVIARADIPLLKDTKRALALMDRYGPDALLVAIRLALSHRALGASYLENILRQNAKPATTHLPVHLDDERLNRIRIEQPVLADYDSFVIARKKGGTHDPSR
jgi:transposase